MMFTVTAEEELEDRRQSFALIRPGRIFSAFNRNQTRYYIAVSYTGGENRVWQVLELHRHNREIFARNAQKQISIEPHGVHNLSGPYISDLGFDDMSCLSVLCLKMKSAESVLDRSSSESFDASYRAYCNNSESYVDE